ncbi:hypothetical protein [Mesorhizobium sp. Cs1299R1N3]|uniref:hypothetical protein n=1 Tax=Mesorhizobium sp. Cs1299R1N3 TaxID=3015173 RepID=UPI00301DDCAD
MSVAPREPEASPPTGYRPKISVKTTLEACLVQARCPDCGERLGSLDNIHRDHVPPLQLRAWDAEAGDTIPAANDPKHIVIRHKDCHVGKTSGGKTKAKAQGDVTEIYRTRRLAREQSAFRERMLKRDPPEEDHDDDAKPKKQKIPGRPFQKRPTTLKRRERR